MAGLGTIRVGKNRRVYCVAIWPVKQVPAGAPGPGVPRAPRADPGAAAMHPPGGGGSLPVPLFPRPLRARIRMRGAAPSLCRTERMDAWPRCLERLEAEFPAEDV